MYKYYNPNPQGHHVGDCTIRAICKALNKDWETVYSALSAYGFMLCDMPSANHVWGKFLKDHGFKRYVVDPGENPFYNVADFCREHTEGVYILAIQEHVVCCVGGNYYDSWDSGNCIPIYYWRRENE